MLSYLTRHHGRKKTKTRNVSNDGILLKHTKRLLTDLNCLQAAMVYLVDIADRCPPGKPEEGTTKDFPLVEKNQPQS